MVTHIYGRLACANAIFRRVESLARFRLAANAIPTWENRRSTDADEAGQPSSQVLPCHHCNVGELGLILAPLHESVFLSLVLDLRQRQVLRELVHHCRVQIGAHRSATLRRTSRSGPRRHWKALASRPTSCCRSKSRWSRIDYRGSASRACAEWGEWVGRATSARGGGLSMLAMFLYDDRCCLTFATGRLTLKTHVDVNAFLPTLIVLNRTFLHS